MVGPRTTTNAHYGLRDWLSQRVTAVVITLYTLLCVAIAFVAVPNGGLGGYEGWRGLFAGNAFRVATFLFLVAVYYHAWVGVRNILMDYVKPTGVRFVLETVVICALVAYTGWAVQILWGAR